MFAGIWVLSVTIALPSVIFSYVRLIDVEPTKTFLICYPFPPELGTLYPKVTNPAKISSIRFPNPQNHKLS